MLATFGYHQVNVYKQPVVGIYTTGTELLPIDAPLEPGKIRNSNAYMLVGQIRGVGAIPKYLGILPDDFVQSIVNKLDAKVLFNKVTNRYTEQKLLYKANESNDSNTWRSSASQSRRFG